MTTIAEPALKPFRERALAVIQIAWGGEHHVGTIKWEATNGWRGGACRFNLLDSSLATWDFNALTRLVVAAHDQCVRACVLPKMRNLGILLSDRDRTGEDTYADVHPRLEAHVAAIRVGQVALRALAEAMRAPESGRKP
jgi:hypothetical protein